MALKDKLFRNLGWKIGGLVLALALWFHLATEKIYQREFKAIIEVISLAPNLEVASIEPSQVEISFIGTGKQLLQLMLSGKMRLKLDFSLISRPGEYDEAMKPSDLFDIDISSFRSVTLTSGDHCLVIVKSKS